jgi:hypothetical protein
MLGPDTSGPGEDMTKQPSPACLSSTTRGDLETTSARAHPQHRDGATTKP